MTVALAAFACGGAPGPGAADGAAAADGAGDASADGSPEAGGPGAPDATDGADGSLDADGSPDAETDGTASDGDAEIDGGPRPSEGCGAGTAPPVDSTVALSVGGLPREALLHVPSAHDGVTPVPLVLFLHGYAATPESDGAIAGIGAKSDAAGFVLVMPRGSGLPAGWNGGACCGAAATLDVDDVAFLRALVAEVGARACVDERRVYATGMSNGGFLAHRLACEASDLVAAIAPVAGVLGIPEADCAPARGVPVLHFHGDADTAVPYGGNPFLGFPSAVASAEMWARIDGCTGAAHVVRTAGVVECVRWDGCRDGADVTLCTVHGGLHSWPGGVGGTPDMSATDELWAHFLRFTLP